MCRCGHDISWIIGEGFGPRWGCGRGARCGHPEFRCGAPRSSHSGRQCGYSAGSRRRGRTRIPPAAEPVQRDGPRRAALARLRADGFDVREEDAARLSPFTWHHIDMLGRCSFPPLALLPTPGPAARSPAPAAPDPDAGDEP
ncbi:Tn3 family transposase [Streptomyces sp. H27-C3]|nr:Tn3 family transposase [Streptomyces sp. H27-C3]MDJ0460756.1 Tn3 family transposase [Streptomyces sp. H27-C3]